MMIWDVLYGLIGTYLMIQFLQAIYKKQLSVHQIFLFCSIQATLWAISAVLISNPAVKMLIMISIAICSAEIFFQYDHFVISIHQSKDNLKVILAFIRSIGRSVMGVALYYIIISMGDMAAAFLFLKVYQFDLSFARSDPFIYFLSHLIIYGIVVLVIYILKYMNNTFDEVAAANAKRESSTVFYILIVLMIIIMNAALYFRYNTIISAQFTLLNVFIMILYFIFSILFVKTNKNLILVEQKNKDLEIYMNTIENLYTQTKRFRHDYLNLLYGMQGYIREQSWEDLSLYFNDILEESEVLRNNSLILINSIQDSGIKGLLAVKLNNAEVLGIEVNLECNASLKNIAIRPLDLCEVLGILLDNGIEAAMESEDKQISIKLIEADEQTHIYIDNTYKQTPDLVRINEKGYSTKGSNGGMGLWTVKNILGNYKRIICSTTIQNKRFIQELCIQQKK